MTVSISGDQSVVFAGGGTGGHLLPGIAVAEQLTILGINRIRFIGSERSIERQIIEEAGFQHLRLSASSTADLKRAPFRFVWNNSRAFRQAYRFLKTERPAVVIGLGGFASVPVILAASWLTIPIVLLEQNLIPGRANQFLFSRAALVCTSFAETDFGRKRGSKTATGTRIVLTGNPVRKQILKSDSERDSTEGKAETLILVLGGSQGATAVNDAVLAMLEQVGNRLPQTLHFVHQTGEVGYQNSLNEYRRLQDQGLNIRSTVQPFFTDLSEWYQRADLVISRAGATTLAELACLGVPTVLIPYPNSIRDHQLINARFYVDRGAAALVEQTESIAQDLGERLIELLEVDQCRSRMSDQMHKLAYPQAALTVAQEIVSCIVDL